MKVYIVYDHADGTLSRVFLTKKLAEEWVRQGHEGGWLYDEDTSIWEEEVHDTTD